ncbi:hypothetical protein FQA39_LY07515 [Lamprigera yunnana]|nr:hypothetical protein FQA39_LY07515 [Lamprigera yunnana]
MPGKKPGDLKKCNSEAQHENRSNQVEDLSNQSDEEDVVMQTAEVFNIFVPKSKIQIFSREEHLMYGNKEIEKLAEFYKENPFEIDCDAITKWNDFETHSIKTKTCARLDISTLCTLITVPYDKFDYSSAYKLWTENSIRSRYNIGQECKMLSLQ